MDIACKICGKQFRTEKGLKRHLTMVHECTFENYTDKYKKGVGKKKLLKNNNNSTTINNTNATKKVVDLQEYKEDIGQADEVQLLTEFEVEKWGRLSAERFSLKQAISMNQMEAQLENQRYKEAIGKLNTTLKDLSNALKTDVDPEYEAYMQELSSKYDIPRNAIGIHSDTRVIWDLRESNVAPQVPKESIKQEEKG